MSFTKKIEDYLKIIKLGIQNGDKIIEAMMVSTQVKNGTVSPEALAEIMRRKEICASCPFNSENAKKEIGYVPPAQFKDVTHCIHCSCKIGGDNTKEYCLNCNCGIEVWNKHNPDKKLEVKWKSFDINKKEN